MKYPYGALLLFVKDKYKILRGIIDYSSLILMKMRKSTPFPPSDEKFDRVGGA